jgi:hypothetical protein
MAMKIVTAEQLHSETVQVSDMALREPVAIDNRLVLLSLAECRRLKGRDRVAFRVGELADELVEQIARTEMDPRHAHLDSLME